MQEQWIQEQRRHCEESLGKMEASYWLLQQRVDQDIAALRAEHARQTAQQTQSLRDTLQKGIADAYHCASHARMDRGDSVADPRCRGGCAGGANGAD